MLLSLAICGALYVQGAAGASADGQTVPSGAGASAAAPTESHHSGATHAGPAKPPPLPDARTLGVAESALKFCSGLKSQDEAIPIQLRFKLLVRGISDQDLDRIRQSAEYRQAYDAESGFISQVDEHNARRICSQPLARRR